MNDVTRMAAQGAIIVPGCSFRLFFRRNCRVGARVQQRRLDAALNLQQMLAAKGQDTPIYFTGTKTEARFARMQVLKFTRQNQKFDAPHMVYENASQRTNQHGDNLQPMMDAPSAAWNCWLVTDGFHTPRLRVAMEKALRPAGAHIMPKRVALPLYESLCLLYGEVTYGIRRNINKAFTPGEYVRALVTPAPRPLKTASLS